MLSSLTPHCHSLHTHRQTHWSLNLHSLVDSSTASECRSPLRSVWCRCLLREFSAASAMPTTLDVTFYGAPNETVVGFEFLFAILFGMCLIRFMYIWMHRPHHYPNDQMRLAALGARCLRLLSIPMMAALFILFARVDPGIKSGQFWELDSLSRGWWCVIRIMLGVVATLCATVFESHPLFRIWPSLTVPLISILDLLSQANFAARISCIEYGQCTDDTDERQTMYDYAWRDMASAVLTLTFAGISTWCWFLYGVCGNDFLLPRQELRQAATRLDKFSRKPKEARRKTQEENQLEKMLGYN